MSVDLVAESCDCKPETCTDLLCVLDCDECVRKIARSGVVDARECTKCEAYTWYLNGECLRCKYEGRENVKN